jgi:heptosyltransferase-3
LKILIVQLARLGDIYQTWPAIRALKKAQPECEIHILTRAKFQAATDGLDAITRRWTLKSREILEPLIEERPRIDEALAGVGALIEELSNEKFDRVINLSFSPLSSHLNYLLAQSGAVVSGYSRHSDGFLSIPDDASSYFYAQVGPGRANRIHLSEIFADVAGVTLTPDDWCVNSAPANGTHAPIVVHIGASEAHKTYSTHKWLQVVSGLLQGYEGDIILVGSESEMQIGAAVAGVHGARQPINKVGQTTLSELFTLIAQSHLVIGCDSAPVHIAALTGTPVLNLSLGKVNFYETGPKSLGSRILSFASEDDLPSDWVISEALSMVTGSPSEIPTARVESVLGIYTNHAPAAARQLDASADLSWEMIQAVYLGGLFPVANDEIFALGLTRLGEANELAISQLGILQKTPGQNTAVAILDRCDEIFTSIAQMVPAVGILIRWLQTERVRLGPLPMPELVEATLSIHRRMNEVLNLYGFSFQPPLKKGIKDDDMLLG